MKDYKGIKIIGVDHGYGNIKTANTCFPTGVMSSNLEPVFTTDLLIWNGKYHSIGVGHKEFIADKFLDDDYYILTLAAIARELRRERIVEAKVHLAVGLPLTWLSSQKEDFKKYLMKNSKVKFVFRAVEYSIDFVGIDIFPQGFPAVAENLSSFKGANMLCDIGNGTMNLLKITNKKPDMNQMYTEKFGTYQCTLAIRENLMRTHHTMLDEEIVTDILRTGHAEIKKEYLHTATETAKVYTNGIFRRLRERGYDPGTMKLHVVGGGGCLIENFSHSDNSNVFIYKDICATAKGYEYLSMMKFLRG